MQFLQLETCFPYLELKVPQISSFLLIYFLQLEITHYLRDQKIIAIMNCMIYFQWYTSGDVTK